ncbi:MAG: Coenzyme F420 hydrogenase/dehydrogenase, beta subunit C-terminal domain [Euryarchaeota archaeon]|nr:Coenzyme F420 hydrogenase/dehydrogenase, beta subunit C-terminal domain [Euryarchaeota archaeon]
MIDKTYEDLKSRVWDTGMCAGCGACVVVCPADALYFTTGDDVAHPLNTGYCKAAVDGIPCGACYETCPRIDPPQPSEPIGSHITIVAAKAEFKVAKRQSGGAVTAILANALDEGLVDAVVTVAEDPWTLKPSSAVITSSEVLVSHAGSRYNWWVPLLSALDEAVVIHKCRNVAIVGVPCVVQAIQRMRESDHDLIRPYRDPIRLVMGLFCTETFDYGKLVKGKLEKEFGIVPWEIRRFDVKGALELTLDNGTTTSISLEELDDCVRPGCRVCTDLTAPDADISAGAIGSPEGYTTLVIRTHVGNRFMESAIANGKLAVTSKVNTTPIEKLAKKKAERGV